MQVKATLDKYSKRHGQAKGYLIRYKENLLQNYFMHNDTVDVIWHSIQAFYSNK